VAATTSAAFFLLQEVDRGQHEQSGLRIEVPRGTLLARSQMGVESCVTWVIIGRNYHLMTPTTFV
jgi:hypothetical protein